MQVNELQTTHPIELDKFLTPLEASELLQIKEEQLMNGVYSGVIPGVCLDGVWRFSHRALSKRLLGRRKRLLRAHWIDFPVSYREYAGDYGERTQGVIDAYKQGGRYFPILDIENAQFSNLNLTEIDFWDSCLPKADFSGSNLSNACFYATYLRDANFNNADLAGADFRLAFIEGASFCGAKLEGTIFQVYSLKDVDFSMAQFNGVKFHPLNLNSEEREESAF